MIKESMMKWRVRRENGSSIDQEDIRKSLDILDSVLAEYDDGESDTWRHSLPPSSDSWQYNNAINGYACREFSRNRYDVSSTSSDGICFARSNSTNSFQSFLVDGGTSQSMPVTFDQFRKFSPPPVPKRNPATRLSSHENLLLSCESSSVSEDIFDKRRSYAEGFHYPTSSKSFQKLPLSTSKGENDFLSLRGETYKRESNTSSSMGGGGERTQKISNQQTSSSTVQIRRSNSGELSPEQRRWLASSDGGRAAVDGYCKQENLSKNSSVTGSLSSVRVPEVPVKNISPTMQVQRSPSVAQRRAKFEKANQNSMSRIRDDLRQKPSLMKSSSSKSLQEYVSTSKLPDGITGMSDSIVRSTVDPMSVTEKNQTSVHNNLSSDFSNSDQIKSSELNVTGELKTDLRDNCVKSINDVHTVATNDERIQRLDEMFAEVKHLLKTKQIVPLTSAPPSFAPPPPPKPPRKQRETIVKEQYLASGHSITEEPKNPAGIVHNDKFRTLPELKSLPTDLCNGCLRRNSDPNKSQTSTVVCDIPKILPVEVSKIPQLGFSYSMEEDMPPGVKEILTSTPKSEGSTTKSTFNDSISSLGYGSSQSDLDLNFSYKDSNKIPINDLKSQTLPISMKLGPDYYSDHNAGTDCDSLQDYGLRNASFSPGDANSEASEEHFRSSSAPPFKLLEDEKKHKKSIFGMSRKNTKTKNKNESNTTSTKQKKSLDDGIILRKIETLGNEFSLPDFKVDKAAPVEEKKRRSVWRSILRRK